MTHLGHNPASLSTKPSAAEGRLDPIKPTLADGRGCRRETASTFGNKGSPNHSTPRPALGFESINLIAMNAFHGRLASTRA